MANRGEKRGLAVAGALLIPALVLAPVLAALVLLTNIRLTEVFPALTASYGVLALAALTGLLLWRRMAKPAAAPAGETQDLNAALASADARNLAKSKYVRGLSHELRTPLNAVLGYARLLEDDTTLPGPARHSLSVIRRSSEHLSSLVDGLLDISMIEAGRMQVLKDEVLLPEFLRQIADMMRLQAQQRELSFTFEAPQTLPDAVFTDEKRLRQILINLLSNAIRYTRSGGVTLRVTYGGQVARFDVEDTGIGIAPQDIERIFDPFERIAPEHAPEGSGLGLTITRLLTQTLGGDLTVTSTPGQGSCFSVKLMLAPIAATQRVAHGRRIEDYEGARRTILAVDDDAHQRHVLKSTLSAIGFTVLTQSNGRDAIACALADTPDAILLDISMPGLSGWDVATALREQMPRRVPIIMLSAYMPGGARDSALCDAYLMKPVGREKLLDTLGRVLKLDWITSETPAENRRPALLEGEPIQPAQLAELQRLGQIGHLRGILDRLDRIGDSQPGAAPALAALRRLTEDCDVKGYRAAIETLIRHHDA